MTRANLAQIDPFFEPQVAHASTVLLDPTKMGVDTASSATRLGSGSVLLNLFRLLEMIGEGGMSHVNKAVDLRKVKAGAPDPHIAIKVLTVPFASPSDAMAVLSREAHSLQSLTHPNIVRVSDRDNIVFMTNRSEIGVRRLFCCCNTPEHPPVVGSLALGGASAVSLGSSYP